jgi:hypothetical protein
MSFIDARNKFRTILPAAFGLCLSACAVIAPPNHYIGHLPMQNQTQASIDAMIKDGVTRKSELDAFFGYPVADTPSLAAGMHCKEGAAFCIYSVNVTDYEQSVAYVKSVTVGFDKNNVVVNHRFLETRRDF